MKRYYVVVRVERGTMRVTELHVLLLNAIERKNITMNGNYVVGPRQRASSAIQLMMELMNSLPVDCVTKQAYLPPRNDKFWNMLA
jgi:hypothetical protein